MNDIQINAYKLFTRGIIFANRKSHTVALIGVYIAVYSVATLKFQVSISVVTILIFVLYGDLNTAELKNFGYHWKDYNRVAQLIVPPILAVFLQIVFLQRLVSFWFHIFRHPLSLSCSLFIRFTSSLSPKQNCVTLKWGNADLCIRCRGKLARAWRLITIFCILH